LSDNERLQKSGLCVIEHIVIRQMFVMINISPVLVVAVAAVVMVVMTVTVAAHIPPVPSVYSFRA
jgi:hypothetical protein